MEHVLTIRNVTKYYKRRSNLFLTNEICAVDNLNLEIEKGDVFGILGPNGAGKTTTLNIIAGLSKPTSGEVKVFGLNIDSQNNEFRQKIGYLSEENYLPDYLSLADLLKFLTKVFNISPEISRKRIDWVVENLKLKDLLKGRIKNFSSGQKRIAGLSCALLNEPELLILDEPTVYLDPLAVKDLVSIVNNLKDRGRTVIISSHILSQIEKLCNRLIILKDGRLKFYGESKSLLDKGSLEEAFLQLVTN